MLSFDQEAQAQMQNTAAFLSLDTEQSRNAQLQMLIQRGDAQLRCRLEQKCSALDADQSRDAQLQMLKQSRDAQTAQLQMQNKADMLLTHCSWHDQGCSFNALEVSVCIVLSVEA